MDFLRSSHDWKPGRCKRFICHIKSKFELQPATSAWCASKCLVRSGACLRNLLCCSFSKQSLLSFLIQRGWQPWYSSLAPNILPSSSSNSSCQHIPFHERTRYLTQVVCVSSLRTQKRTSRRSYCCSKQRDASFFHTSSIHCTKVITRPRDPRLREHPVRSSENSLPSVRSHNKPNKNPQINNGLCPALVQLNKVQAKTRKLNLYNLLPTEQVWFKGSCLYFLVYLQTLPVPVATRSKA